MRLPGRKLLSAVVVGVLMAAAVAGGAVTAAAKRVAARHTASTELVVGLGDSVASGEGNPDVERHGFTAAVWENERCHRSKLSFEAMVAHRLKVRHPGLKFIYLACSGASITRGLLGPYAGIVPASPDLPAQVEEAKQLVQPPGSRNRKADAVMVSIGANDLQFGYVASFCAETRGNCQDLKYPNAASDVTLAQWMERELESLPELYDRLAAALFAPGGSSLVANSHDVFIAEYPDLVSRSLNELCNEIYFAPGRYVNSDEVKWLYHHFFLPLDSEIQTAAKKHHWTVVYAPQEFKAHGYCAPDNWIVTLAQSLYRQGNTSGTLHPDRRGQTAMANAFYPFVSKALAPELPVSAPPPHPAPPPVTG